MKEINLEEILRKEWIKWNFGEMNHDSDVTVLVCKNAMKEACIQVLELAGENAKINVKSGWGTVLGTVDKQSILNTINQIK